MNGTQLRDEGIALVLGRGGLKLTTPAAIRWRANADRAIAALAANGEPFTAEDLRRLVGDPPTQNMAGAVMMVASRSGLIERAGYMKADRASSHARNLAVWRGTNPDGTPIPSPETDERPREIVSPLRERWVCAICGEEGEPTEETLNGDYRQGRCGSCNRRRMFIRQGR